MAESGGMRNVGWPLGAALALAAVMTLGDYLWAALRLPHRMAYGLVHGAVMCLCLGLAIGLRAGKPAQGALVGPVIGLVAAGWFYLLAPWLRFGAMLPAWMLFWILFALLQQRLGRGDTLARGVLRGLVAAVVSGAVFYAISGIWTGGSTRNPNYLLNLAAWTVAFLPGFVALFLGRGKASMPSAK